VAVDGGVEEGVHVPRTPGERSKSGRRREEEGGGRRRRRKEEEGGGKRRKEEEGGGRRRTEEEGGRRRREEGASVVFPEVLGNLQVAVDTGVEEGEHVQEHPE
jgi:hypothetical protein